uniref:Uncharacterized protein n=1 Tax=Rhizophora mucronata TaxID=61149 RepID=A0A2P2NRB2_RHIMU
MCHSKIQDQCLSFYYFFMRSSHKPRKTHFPEFVYTQENQNPYQESIH